MAKLPGLSQKTYHGLVRANMRSALNHLRHLINWDFRWRANDCSKYPQQLATDDTILSFQDAASRLDLLLKQQGPIPKRTGCP